MTLRISNLNCTRGDNELFTNVQLKVNYGDAVRVVGANGKGKTSFLKTVCGLITPSSGKILWKNVSIHTLDREYLEQLVFLGHNNGLNDELTAWENLQSLCEFSGITVNYHQAIDALDQSGLLSIAELPVRVLSQGQRRRVAISRLYISLSKHIWLLDEPFAALDPAAIDLLCELINRFLARGGILIYTTHQEVKLQAVREQLLSLEGAEKC